MTPVRAGWMLSLMHGVGVLGTLIVPPMASNRSTQKHPVLWIVLFELLSLTGLLLQSSLFFVVFWTSILGFCLGASFGLALLFIVLRSRDSDSANELSGMSQSVGYTIAATGPVLFGALIDLFVSHDLNIRFGYSTSLKLVVMISTRNTFGTLPCFPAPPGSLQFL